MIKHAHWVGLFCIILGLISAETARAASGSATYDITFTSVWEQNSHSPNTIPLPPNDHWSRLVGATHKSGTSFWTTGDTASNGIRRMAEWGWNVPLKEEVDAEIALGNAGQWVEFSSSLGSAAGVRTHTITVNNDFPHFTLVSMLAPSPDWFVGVNGLELQDSNGEWKSSITTDLYIYDAGTDACTTFANCDIEDLGNPITNKHGVATFSSAPIGTLTLTLQTPTAVQLASAQTTQPSSGLIAILFLLLVGYSANIARSRRRS